MSETGKSSKSFSSPYSLLHVFIDSVIIGNALSVFDRIGAKRWSLASVNCTLRGYAGIWRKCLRLSQVKNTSLNPNNMVEENLECAYGGESSAGCPALHQTCTRSPCQKTEHSSRLLPRLQIRNRAITGTYEAVSCTPLPDTMWARYAQKTWIGRTTNQWQNTVIESRCNQARS